MEPKEFMSCRPIIQATFAAGSLTIAVLVAPSQAHTNIDRINAARLYGQWESTCNAHLVGYLTRREASQLMQAAMNANSVEVKAGAMYFLDTARPKCWRLMTSFDWWKE